MVTGNPHIPNIENTPEVGTQLSSGPARPLVLFPVRLETRFFQQADGTFELRVRVYPDKVHIDSHEPELTDDELTWGKHFWEQTWRAAKNEERLKTAWRQLADRLDPQRAAWVARVLKPLNPDDRPKDEIGNSDPLPDAVRFPTSARKDEAWSRAPRTRVLPDFWSVLGYKDGRLVVNAKGGPIKDPLATGPNPSRSANVDEMGIDQDMTWMVDYEAAEEVGMAVRAKLSQQEAAAGLDFLLVVGIKDSPDANALLAELLKAHHYTDGLSFVPQGTPSNNTQDAPSGFTSNDPGHEASYLAERTEPPAQSADGSNSDLLIHAFGLAKADHVLDNVPHGTAREQFDASQMNTALWEATWGYFLLQMLGADGTGDSPLKDEDIAWARNHFIDYVRAGGPLPALRIGKQPYGVLPVTSLSAWKPQVGQENEFKRDILLQDCLNRLRDIWRRNFQDVPRLGRSEDVAGRGLVTDLAEVLSMDALSSSYSIRQLLGRHYLDNLLVFLSADFFLDIWEAEIPEIPPEVEPPEIEDPPEELPPHLRIQFIRQQQARRLAFIREQEAIRRNAMRAREQMLARISGKRASLPEWWAVQERLTGSVLNELGLSWRPRMARAVFSTPVATLSGALVQADKGLSLSPNYIESLLAARDLSKPAWFSGETLEQPSPHTLLHLLLRHSMLLEYANAASRLLIDRNPSLVELRREPELLSVQPGEATQTIWEQFKSGINVAGEAEPLRVGEYLLNFTPSGEPDVTREPKLKRLSEFRASLSHLKSLDVATLEQLMTGTLDLCSHRLDAWITSFATKRLAEMRRNDPSGVLLGAYGWVMNLKRAEAQAEVATPAGEQGPVFQSDRNPGFIHTPSLTQASAVAILRSGHLAHSSGNQTPDDLLAIDLSSERVRLATWLLDGVRQAQPLGALLGYRFERRLQEARKPQFISVFRELAPLVARKLEAGQATTGPVEAIAANNVVDGLGLLRRWQQGKEAPPPQWTDDTIPFGQQVNQKTPALPAFDPNDADFKVIRDEFVFLEQAVDSVSDALMAESVYQVVRGNPLRAASTVESIAGGETPPPELEVVRTPRTGVALTHRVVTLFSGDAQLPPHWSVTRNSFRADAEPHLNAWAARMLPNPANVRCLIERLDPATERVLETKEVRLDQLGLAPLDYVYAIEGGKSGQQAEIEQRILYAIARQRDGFAPGSLLRVNPIRKPEWKIDELSYGEFGELLRTARKLLTSGRALDDDDLNPPDRTTDFSADVSKLTERASRAEESVRQTSRDFQTQLSTPETASLEMLRELILRSAAFGVAGAVPLSVAGDFLPDRQVLLTQAGSIRKELEQRVVYLDDLAIRFNAATARVEDRHKHALARLQLVFGKAFIVLPLFKATNVEELERALADSEKVQGGDPLASVTWFHRMARVRDGVARLRAALSYSEALNTGEKLNLKIAQLPYAEDDRWVGLPLEAGKSLPGGKLSLAVQSAGKVDVRQPLAGVLIDEWVEVVPSTTETTGIALQYDQPNAAPPQSILVAVPPDVESPWTTWSLQQVLLETLDLARIRAVDSVTLDEVGHYLPALYFAYNTLGDTVSTDFTAIK